MANFLRNKAVWAVSATVGALYFVPKLTGNKSNVFETPGTQNIGNRWSAGGGAPTHTPAGATKRGDPNSVEPSTHNPAGAANHPTLDAAQAHLLQMSPPRPSKTTLLLKDRARARYVQQ
ncbi:hypothetical protein B0J12DRAFT_235345 [Macrophomina phaseolina]|uniref:Uncharacterized protein n=1 Tax=Macrophomina phaseolina TaxID=35725 RepID=A0ABQ8GQ95_9PEZI|nr:hypothetical protein B0J12DRAFT_235345 [Macrophomina phaseolina]